MDSDVPFHKIAPSDKGPLMLRPSPGFRKDSPHPERQKPNITGRWESVVEDPHNPPALTWILLVNQSSTWIEGRLVEVLDGRSRRSRAIQAFSGEASPSGTAFAIQPSNGVEAADGTVEIDGSDLIVTFNKGDWPVDQRFVLMPDGQRATFFGLAIDEILNGKGPIDAETKNVMTRAELMPLHSWQMRKLQRLLDPEYINNLLFWGYDTSHWYNTAMEQSSRRRTAAERFQDLIHGAVTTAMPGHWLREDLPLIRALARTILGLNPS